MRRPESLLEAADRMNDTIAAGRVVHDALSYHMSDFRHALKGNLGNDRFRAMSFDRRRSLACP